MPPNVDVALPSQEAADMATYFDRVHKADEERLSLWPLEDEPLLWFTRDKEGFGEPDWNNDPSHFSLLWRDGGDGPIRIPGPHVQTNLLGRTVAEVFADFPTDFDDSPASSPSLSPVSPVFSPSSFGEENSGQIPTHDLPDTAIDVDEMSQQLSDRIRFNSPPQSPRALSPSTCNPLSTNSLSDAFSSSSSTLSAGRSSNTSSTYAVSPSPQPFSSRSTSPAPGLRRSPRRSPPLSNLQVAEPGEQFNGSATDSIKDWNTPVAPLTQIVLEEQPLDDVRLRRSAKRTGSSEDDGAFEFMEDDEGTRPRKKALSVAPKRHPCTVPGCSESFTRPNDVLRHVKNAAVHKGSSQQAEALAASSTLCKYCGEELSRPDAARRHELKASCGKRTIRRKSTYSMLPA